jgi:hypothetical protein
MRICGGLMVLYTHIVGVSAFGEFYGLHSWEDRAVALRIHTEAPFVTAESVAEDPEERAEQIERFLSADTKGRTKDELVEFAEYQRRWAIDPRLAPRKGSPGYSVWFLFDSSAAESLINGMTLLFMFALVVGFCTRTAAVGSWLASLSYVHRSPSTLFGADAMMLSILFYLMIGPSGDALSVDRWLARRRAAKTGTSDPGPVPTVGANIALRLFQVHLCIIYAGSGFAKLLGQQWWNGTALWFVLGNPMVAPLSNPLYREALSALCRRPVLWDLVMTAGALFTFAVELGFPVLVWTAWRPVMIAGALLMHAGIGVFMRLPVFSLYMAVLILSFWPGGSVARNRG